MLDWTKPVSKLFDIVDQAVTDKDANAKLKFGVQEMAHEMRLAELNIKTVPWVDALHKLGRPLISVITAVVAGVVLVIHPDIEPAKLLAVGGPTGLYTAMKGRGR